MRSFRMPYSVLIAFLFIMEEEIEEWKDIEGFEGYYQISSFGRLKSFKVYSCGYIMSMVNKTGGYFSVILQTVFNKKHTRIHRLVGQYFVPNPENKPFINHKDLNKQNNHKNNLEWSTAKENNEHAREHKPSILKGIYNYNKNRRTPVLQFTLDGVFIKEFESGIEASKETKVCQRNIYQVASKTEYRPGLTRKQAGGFIWKYKE